jgi:hypothetical protein
MVPTGENRSTPQKLCSSTTLAPRNRTWTELASNLCLRGDRPGPWHGPGAFILTGACVILMTLNCT